MKASKSFFIRVFFVVIFCVTAYTTHSSPSVMTIGSAVMPVRAARGLPKASTHKPLSLHGVRKAPANPRPNFLRRLIKRLRATAIKAGRLLLILVRFLLLVLVCYAMIVVLVAVKSVARFIFRNAKKMEEVCDFCLRALLSVNSVIREFGGKAE